MTLHAQFDFGYGTCSSSLINSYAGSCSSAEPFIKSSVWEKLRKDLSLNATTTALYIRACLKKNLCWWIHQHPIRVGLRPFFKAGAIKSEAVAFTNGIRDHPFLLSIVNEGFNDVDEKNKVC